MRTYSEGAFAFTKWPDNYIFNPSSPKPLARKEKRSRGEVDEDEEENSKKKKKKKKTSKKDPKKSKES